MIDVFIAGAQKAGTTSLLRYLEQHPKIQSHPQMEMGFFSIDDEYEKGIEILEKKYRIFPNSSKLVLAKQANLSSDIKAINRLHGHSPACKIIFSKREPVERSFSSYLMEKRYGGLKHDFDYVVNHGLANPDHWHFKYIIELGNYSELLSNLRSVFPENQIKVVQFQHLTENPQRVVNDIYSWLSLRPVEIKSKIHNSKSEPAVRPLLRAFGSAGPTVKKIAISLIGHKHSISLAKLIAGRRRSNNSKSEKLDDYPEAIRMLENHFSKYE